MSKQEFLQLMNYPEEWEQFEMYPQELFEIQLSGYVDGNEKASEHDRFGAFLWWLEYLTSKEQLIALTKLSFFDADQLMASDVRKRIRESQYFDDEVATLMEKVE